MTVLTQVPANVRPDTTKALEAGKVGEAVVAGNVIYRNTVTNRWWKYDADGTDAATQLELAIAMNSAPGAEQPIQFQRLDGSLINVGSAVEVGRSYWAAGTGGGIQDSYPDTGDNAVFIGVGKTTALIETQIRNFGVVAPAPIDTSP